jgi:hypothetical protein
MKTANPPVVLERTASRDGKTIKQESRYDDPVKGPCVWRAVTRIKDDNTVEFEMYYPQERQGTENDGAGH